MTLNENSPAVVAARSQLEQQFVDNPLHDAHTVYWGLKNGSGPPCLVVCVPKKVGVQSLDPDKAIPSSVQVVGEEVLTDVVEMPEFRAYETPFMQEWLEASAWALRDGPEAGITNHRYCQSPVIRGGAQIQPRGQNWVGTFGFMGVYKGQIVAVTNAHVTGLNASPSTRMAQPSSGNRLDWGKVIGVFQINFGQPNKIDCAMVDPTINGKHTIAPEQIGLGRLGTEYVKATVGKLASKTGRTTGVTHGRCVGVGATSQVNYGNGRVARFIDQDIYRGDSGNFSAGGDSGSAIVERETNNVMSLLFAGGGGQTIGNPSRYLAAVGIQPYRGE